MDSKQLNEWIERCAGQQLVGATGLETAIETGIPRRRVDRIWLQMHDREPLAFGVDSTSGFLCWEAGDPTQLTIDDLGNSRLVDVGPRAALVAVDGLAFVGGQLIRFGSDERPSALRLEFEGGVDVYLMVWGDALEAWGAEDLERLAKQGWVPQQVG